MLGALDYRTIASAVRRAFASTMLFAAKGDVQLGTGPGTYGTQSVGAEGSSPIADPSQTTGWQWVRLGAGTVRQSVLSSALDTNGYAAGITTGAGLRPGLDASPTPMVIAFASGFGAIGSQDLVATLSADVVDPLAADLKLSNTAYVHATWASLSSVTWGSCYVPPDYGYTFDRTRGALLNFEGINGATTTTDDFGNTWALTNGAQIDTAQFKFGASSLKLDGVNDFAKSTSFTSFGDGSWEVAFWFRIAATPGVGVNAVLFEGTSGAFGVKAYLANTAGTIKLTTTLSSTGAANDIANGTAGTNTVWTTNQWNRLRIVFDALAGTYKFYLSLNGAAETADMSIASSARICAITSFRLGIDNDDVSSPFTGWFDAFRFIRAATNTTTEVPAAVAPAIGDYPYHFFSIPEMKMYEATAASAVAGTNPTLTARNRCFIAEADTSGAAVTAVRNYALRGEYLSTFTTPLPGANVLTSVSDNLGVPLKSSELEAKCLTADNGYVSGDHVSPYANESANATTEVAPIMYRRTRNTTAFQSGSNSLVGTITTSGAAFTMTLASWAYRLKVKRGF